MILKSVAKSLNVVDKGVLLLLNNCYKSAAGLLQLVCFYVCISDRRNIALFFMGI